MNQYSDVQFTHAECGYLQVLEELGLPGLALLVVALAIVGNWCRLAVGRAKSQRLRVAAAAACAGLVVSALHSIVDFVWYVPACMTLTLALAACIWRLAAESVGVRAVRRVVLPAYACGGLASAVTVLFMAVAVTQWGPACAARHGDQLTRLSQQQDDMRLIQLAMGQVDDVSAVARQAESQLAAMSRELEAVLRHDDSNVSAHCRLAGLRLQQFELAQRDAENNMSLAQIRDAAMQSNFSTLQAQNQWLNVAIPENRPLLDQALRHARRAVQLSPLYGEAYLHLAQLGFLAGDGPRAKQAYLAQALRVRPYDGEVLMAVGSELALAGQMATATKYWLRVFRHAPRYREQIIAVFAPQMPAKSFIHVFQPDVQATERLFAYYRKLGYASHAETTGRYYLAQLDQQRASSRDAITADRWYQAYVVCDYLGDSTRAISSLESAVAQAPDDFLVRRKLGRQLLRNQQFARAQDHLRWCVQGRPATSPFNVTCARPRLAAIRTPRRSCDAE